EGALPEDREAFYELAYKVLRGGEPERARELFKKFLAKWPNDPLSDNAQYWMGESYYVRNQYHNAVVEFQRVLEKYPEGDKVPDALLKLGICFVALGICDDAKLFFEE